MNGDWLDFKAIKDGANVEAVLEHLGLKEHLKAHGMERVGWCPFGSEHGKKDSFSVNVEKKNFQCFVCKARGSVIDLVAKMKNVNLRESATMIAMMSDGKASEPQKSESQKDEKRPYGKRESLVDTQRKTPSVMSFSVASRLVNEKKINSDDLLVIDMTVGMEWTKENKE